MCAQAIKMAFNLFVAMHAAGAAGRSLETANMRTACRFMPRVQNMQTHLSRDALTPSAQRIMTALGADGTKANSSVLCKAASQQGEPVHAETSTIKASGWSSALSVLFPAD